MANTNFVTDVTVIEADWLNDANDYVYKRAVVNGLGAAAATNSTIIQAALDTLTGGGVLEFIQSGTFDYDTGLTWTQTGTTSVNPGIKIIGQGRRTTVLNYTGISGFGLSLTGATGMAISATGRNGLIEGITISGIGFTGTGKSSGNTDGGIYVQGYNHFMVEDCLISDFGQDGIHLDRLYYNLAPDATLDDRGSFAHIKDSEISLCGRTGLQAGGLNSATDYSADHLRTDNLHITTCGISGAKVYANNWTDVGSLFYGDAIGVHLYALNTDILTQNVTMVGSRIEGGQSDCMLKIDSCLSGHFMNMFFPGHAGPLPTSQIKIAGDAAYNIGNLTFDQCIHQTATTVYDVIGTGGVGSVRIVNPRFAVVTNEVVNTASKPVQMIKGNTYERITGGSAPIALDGVAGKILTAAVTGDAADWFEFDNSGRKLFMGNGSGTGDISITLSALTPEGAITANPGSIHFNTGGGAGTCFYVKESGTGNTGWAAK